MQHGILERDPKGGSDWASPIVVVRKAHGNLKICGDLKVGVNHKICSDGYPIPDVKTIRHELADT